MKTQEREGKGEKNITTEGREGTLGELRGLGELGGIQEGERAKENPDGAEEERRKSKRTQREDKQEVESVNKSIARRRSFVGR